MASLFSKIAAYVRSPKGRRMTEQAKQMAKDPRRRAQAQQMLRKFRKR
jgi:GTP cyclohydrolase II